MKSSRVRSFLAVVHILLFAHAFGTCELRANDLRVVETEQVIAVYNGEAHVLSYNKVAPQLPQGMNPVYQRSGFLHPVLTPAGAVLTETYPEDHPHQHGIFTAWVKTSYAGERIDFWNLGGKTGRVVHERVVYLQRDDSQVKIEVELLHQQMRATPQNILREHWTITVVPTDSTYHCFDLRTVQRNIAAEPLVIDEHHYGGFAFRGPSEWLSPNDSDLKGREEVSSGVRFSGCTFLTDSGKDRDQGNQQPAKWVVVTGKIDAQERSIAVLSHPRNFRAAQPVRLHPTKPYFCFAPCITGKFEIAKERPYEGSYRFLLTDAEPAPDWLDQQWEAWASEEGTEK